jgi:protein-S-isoprenylcysteine O-methyltransferase Ste14
MTPSSVPREPGARRVAKPRRRWGIPALFGLAAAGTGLSAVSDVHHALTTAGTRAWLVALYALLRTAIAVAFALFTIGRSAPRRPARDPFAFLACTVALGAVVLFAGPGSATPDAVVLTGELIAITSCMWLLVSVLFLGRAFSVLPEARRLVTRGPYAVIRHPVYLGEIGACCGLAVASPSLANTILLAALIAAQSIRMGLEERALSQAFPEYRAYALRTPRLIPRWPTRLASFGGLRSPGDRVDAGDPTSATVSRATSRA